MPSGLGGVVFGDAAGPRCRDAGPGRSRPSVNNAATSSGWWASTAVFQRARTASSRSASLAEPWLVWARLVPGSLGCGVSGVTVSCRQTRSGIDDSTLCSSVASAAWNRPQVRHWPVPSGGRHSRSRCPCAASSAARAASRPRIASTSAPVVPSGTVVTMSTRNSIVISIRHRAARTRLGSGPRWCGKRCRSTSAATAAAATIAAPASSAGW